MKKINLKSIIVISIFLHIIAVIFSTGFHQFDEHFQIYEFLNFKLGNSPESDLPWEYASKMRSWFQVYLYAALLKGSSLLGITSPFIHAFIFRLFTSLLGVYSIYRLIPYIKSQIKEEKYQLITLALMNFCWFIPYIQTRTSAESLSSTFFLLGFSFFITPHKDSKIKHSLISGLFLGAAYLCKYQVALMVMFLWFWALVFKKRSKLELSLCAISISVMIALGIAIDYIGYGEVTFGPWNMFDQNLLQGKMKNFGVDPWWYFFSKSFKSGIAPISIPLIVTTLLAIWKFPKSAITWIFVPYFVFHSLISHKELRFIFPVIIFSPLYLGLLISLYQEKLTLHWKKKWLRGLTKTIIGINFILLVGSVLKPANPAVNLYKYIYHHEDITTIKTEVESPYTMVGLNLNFYKKDGFKVQVINDYKQFVAKGSDSYLFFNKGHHILAMEKEPNCKSVYMAYPRWTLDYNIGNWLSRSRVWSLYYCN